MEKLKKILRKLREGEGKKALAELLWLYRMVGRYRGQVLLHSSLTLVCALLSTFVNFQVRSLMEGLVGRNWAAVGSAALIYITVGLSNVLLTMFVNTMAGRVRANIRNDLANRTYSKILWADWETVIQHHSGDLMTRVQEDVTTVAGATVGWIPAVLYQGTQAVIALCVILYYDYSMLLMVAIIVPLVAFSSRSFMGRLYASNQREREISSRVMSLYKESFQHLQSIKGFGLVDTFVHRMEEQLENRRKVDVQVSDFGVLSWAVMYTSGQLAALVCLGWALMRIYQGKIDIAILALLAVMASMISGAFKALIQQVPQAMSSISASERIRSILELPEEMVENEQEYNRMLDASKDSGAAVKVSHLDFAYHNGTQVLKDVSYTVNSGEIVALVGPSGEGKTTMLRLLLGIVKTEHPPMIQVNDTCLPVSAASRRLMAYVPQGNTVLNGTIADNLRMFNQNATDEEIAAALKEACAYEFVEKLPGGIYHNIGESGIGFSEGQNQRLAIARALMCKTPILLLDEATSALDVATERRVLANLMKGAHKRTCILTTHRPSVLSMCDRVYRIAEKTVREIGEEEIREVMNEF